MPKRRVSRGVVGLFAVVAVVASTVGMATAAPRHDWVEVTSPHVGGNSSEIYAMTATGAGDVWAFGFDRANIGGTFEWRVLGQHWDGTQWTRLNTLDRETAPAQDFIWGASATASNDVWIVGSSLKSSSERLRVNLVEHWNGSSWSIDNSVPVVGLGGTLLAVDARTSTDVWAVGETHFPDGSDYNGFVVHRGAGGWSQVPFTAAVPGCNPHERGELDAVDAVAANDVYVAGWCQSQPVGAAHGFVMHWNGGSWSLLLAGPSHSAFHEITTAPDGQVWVGGDNAGSRTTFPVVWHGTADGLAWTSVPVRHSGAFAGTLDALSVTSSGTVIAGQLTDPRGNPTQTYALRLLDNGTWRKERVVPNSGNGYARIHAAAVEPTGTQWLGGTTVGGTHLDPISLAARFAG